MDDEFLSEMGLPKATEITCDECGYDVDVSDTVNPEEMFERVAEHGEEEHGWGTEEAGLRHIVTRFGELALECRTEVKYHGSGDPWRSVLVTSTKTVAR